jgi:mRNA interferase RelE/StbE
MTYKLKFHPDAMEEFEALSGVDKAFFKRKLKQRLENPHNPGSRLSGSVNLYKIKRMRPPLRMTYHVDDNLLIVTALSVGKRDGDVYKEMLQRF